MKITTKEESKRVVNTFWKVYDVRLIPKCVGICEKNNSKLIALQKKKEKGEYLKLKNRIVIEQDGMRFVSKVSVLYGKHNFEDIATLCWMTYYDESANEDFTILMPSSRNNEGLMMFSDTFLSEFKDQVEEGCKIDKDDLIEAFFTLAGSDFKAGSDSSHPKIIQGKIGSLGAGIGRLIDEDSKICVFTRFIGYPLFQKMVELSGDPEKDENRIPLNAWMKYYNKTEEDV